MKHSAKVLCLTMLIKAHKHYETEINIPMQHMRKLRLRGTNELARGPTGSDLEQRLELFHSNP